ncbi:VOC family protein [Haloarchaeobius sp. DFWS5]|uniref:VOC family protein n=1 Tax=Haloarchaeobius sp. DFWS5 TaxID=3446114 RepID=UPI003EBB741D
MDLFLDHVATAWRDLDDAVAALDAVDLPSEYGGEHADGTTEMRIVGFPDGSYLECITNTGAEPPVRWPTFIHEDAGPCAWCLGTDDVRGFMHRCLDSGERVAGPNRDGRRRPDGTQVEWETATVGDDLGLTLPFAIEDRTPRRYRVSPNPALDGSSLVGLAEVLVLTAEPDPLVRSLDQLLRLPRPEQVDADEFGATLHRFAGAPVAVAEPTSDRLRQRLDTVGSAVCAVLVETDDFDAASEAFALGDELSWGDDRVAWFDHPSLDGRVGVVEYGW